MSENNSNKGLKSKLDLIWAELQTNLPSIDFNESLNEDQIDLNDDLAIKDYLNNDELSNLNDLEDLKNDYYFNNDLIDRIEKASISDVYLKETDELNIRLENFNKIKKSNSKLISNSTDSVQTAAKITKNIFESTNPKLNMDIFNTVNFDELLNSVDKKQETKLSSSKLDSSSQTTPRIIDDENIIKKLAEMSVQISKDDSLNNLNLKTGAISNDLTEKNTTNKSINTESLKISLNSIDDVITNDLKQFLKTRNIRDGNLTETRKLDLRSSQNMILTNPIRVYSKPRAEDLFKEILNDDSIYPDSKSEQKLKFINDYDQNSSSSTSDSDDEKVDDNLWIERYRRQKMLNQK